MKCIRTEIVIQVDIIILSHEEPIFNPALYVNVVSPPPPPPPFFLVMAEKYAFVFLLHLDGGYKKRLAFTEKKKEREIEKECIKS